MSAETTKTRASSQKRIDANRENARKSTGPRTPEGKSRSRFNRLQHGLAATVTVLPGEDPAAYQARVDAQVESLAPQNQVEFDLLERLAATTWSLERATRAETARLCHNIRHEAIEREGREREEAVALGQRLLWDARGPWQGFPHGTSTGLKWERRTSWSQDPADPNNPAVLLVRLERTAAGCHWLLDCWAQLRARLEPGQAWVATDQFKAARLLGKTPLDAIDDPDVILIFLAGSKLVPEDTKGNAFTSAIRELMANRDEDKLYYRELKKRQLDKLTPPDAAAAREVLKRLVDRQTSRLLLILARHQEIAEADAAEAPTRLAFDPSHEGDKLRRYVLSAARLVNQTLTTFIKVRKSLVTEESFVNSPLSFANQDTEGAPEPNAGRGSHESAPGVPEDLSARPEAVGPQSGKVSPPEADRHNSEPAEAATHAGRGSTELAEVGNRSDQSDRSDRSDRSNAAAEQPTTDNGQSTQIPRTEANETPRTEANELPRTEPNDIPRTEPNDIRRTEPNDVLRTEPNDVLRTEPNDIRQTEPNDIRRTEPNATGDTATDHREPTTSEFGELNWPELHKVVEQARDRIHRALQARQHAPRAPAQRTSPKKQARSGAVETSRKVPLK